MQNFELILLKAAVLLGLVVTLHGCDEPVTGDALTFYGECISDQPEACKMLAFEGTDLTLSVNKEPVIEPRHFATAELASIETTDQPVVLFSLTPEGTSRFEAATRARVGKVIVMMDGEQMVSAPVVREPISGGSGQVSVNLTETQAANLVARILANRTRDN